MSENQIWDASLSEMKQGYKELTQSFECLICSKHVEKGLVYSHEEKLYEAERFMKLHIELQHESVFMYFLQLDKKITGITEHQTMLLRLFYEGKSDKEIQQELEIGSASTIRQHRFAFKEKERQAKTLLTLMSLLKEKDEHAPKFIEPHVNATMVDDRYAITESEKQAILDKFLPDVNGHLTRFPPKEKQRIVVLTVLAKRFDESRMYTEKEVNEIVKTLWDDITLVRRYLISYGFLDRKRDGSAYWVKK
ncbi:DUF2087 domain-containing protein [Solibacillus sp. FSL H8-0538]|uniref:DUF2087 domain-containing protein n=1 Tax=Solibacillus sp. FSL H8-0538 TaxID=2921400 RepID=UPI0030FC5052